MPDPQDPLALLIGMVQRLETKVDAVQQSQATRAELESLRHTLDSFVLKREFEVYRDAHEQWANTVLAGVNAQLAVIVPRREVEQCLADHEQRITALARARGAWARWTPTILGTAAGLAGAAATWFHK